MMILSNQIQTTKQLVIDTLGISLKAIYLYGSYVDGGLKHKSDIDFFVVVDTKLTQENKQLLINELLLLSGAIDNKENKRYLEITIVNQEEFSNLNLPIHREFQYGEWLREAFLSGYIPERTLDQDLTILLRQIKQSSLTLYGILANELLPIISDNDFKLAILSLFPLIIEELEQDTTNVILTLSRMLYSLKTGKITSKDKAVDYTLSYVPKEFSLLLTDSKNRYLENDSYIEKANPLLLKEFACFMTQVITLNHETQ
ncbi:DUF4111 domain-containing protein [Myroides marinus]|uniref:aminoglycoside adenylyltransferase domain-containing protein n=1 Tax=Myroides marinus TaxID=703342 RepID=UPI002575D0A7|nr:aminoglycoside adenylyltransferase domain-containing protein [Myroides marinus]MDM1352468.1 DUF4111 domain-containing protein [Myroides marinus]MDM1359671.1 DUF4111 domain-containing protein [Myroides marinus]